MTYDSWSLTEERFEEEFLARSESLFSIGNGYLGFRGFFCEREPAHHPGVFINGFYEISPIHYGEDAYGFARFNQTMVDLPDCRYLTVTVDGQRFDMKSVQVDEYRKKLDFHTGMLSRTVRWTTTEGKKVVTTWETIISMEHKHVGAVRLQVSCASDARISVSSSIAMPASRAVAALDPRVGTMLNRPSLTSLGYRLLHDDDKHPIGFEGAFKTVESALHLTCGALHECTLSASVETRTEEDGPPSLVFMHEGRSLELCKHFYYLSAGRPGESFPLETIRKGKFGRACTRWHDLVASQRNHYIQFWEHALVTVEGDEKIEQALRFNLLQLHQSTGTDGMSSLAAKGLTGSGYEGHYFWDTEIYGMPFFNHTDSKTARALISYRISLLDHGRARARDLAQRGALYPWRTINGWEASAYFPAGTAQYHINADIAYSIFQYLAITDDLSILTEGGAELLFETARLWYDLGYFNPEKKGLFCINEVTGPDEYSALVDNNAYTNLMARYHLGHVCSLARRMRRDMPDAWNRITKVLNLQEEELEQFAQAANMMYIPFDAQRGITLQDDSFIHREKWDAAKRGPIKHPMLLHYHPLVIYRHQLLKQADTVLAMFLLHDAFPWYLRKRNFDFYEPLTTGDSSLSACIQGIMAFDCGYVSLGDAYSRQTALMDIDDLHHNTKDGLHTAAMAGSWMALVYGMAGYRMVDGVPAFRPQLPGSYRSVSFSLSFPSSLLHITIDRQRTVYQVKGTPRTIRHRSETVVVGSEAISRPTRATCKAVIFDLDGVVTSTDEYHYRAWKRLADAHGWAFDQEVNRRLRGISRMQSLQVILDHNGVTLPTSEMDTLCELKNRWYRASLASLTPQDILDGIVPLLDELRRRGIATAIASASRNAPYILGRLGLEKTFDAVVPAHEVVRGKPDPEIFARAADLLGLYPEECTGIEDAQAGVDALREAMMRTVGVGPAVNAADCDAHVDSTGQLAIDLLLF